MSKKIKSVVSKNTNIRKDNLLNNNGKYEHDSFKYETDNVVGGIFMVDEKRGMVKHEDIYTESYENMKATLMANHISYEDVNTDVESETKITSAYTSDKIDSKPQKHNNLVEYSQSYQKEYGLDKDNVEYYVRTSVKPSFRVNEFDGYGDYMSYVFDVYGRDETYAGHIGGLLKVSDMVYEMGNKLINGTDNVDTISQNKTFADVIDELKRYSDVGSSMERSSVGYVKDINVPIALSGEITTNKNNYDGRDTKIGMIGNYMYANTLYVAAQINSMRRPKYITSETAKLYGNNLNNINSLSSLFLIDDETGRINDSGWEQYIVPYTENDIISYLTSVNPNFELPLSEYDYEKSPKYAPSDKYYQTDKGGYERYNPIFNEYDDTVLINGGVEVSGYSKLPDDEYIIYSEGDIKDNPIELGSDGDFSDKKRFKSYKTSGRNNLLDKTNEFLINRRNQTLISRFHDAAENRRSLIQSSVSEKFGISHGRNLLTKQAFENGSASVTNGYSNPYCRVWTNHHQYSKVKHLIRPFMGDEDFLGVDKLQESWVKFRGHNGAQRLADNTVLNKNGFINITPSEKSGVDIKRCMFSIENLAWKDVLSLTNGKKKVGDRFIADNEPKLSEEQRGPNGGRIMWFPPYNLTFRETASASWNSTDFIGRGEPVYTYTNSSRGGTLTFSILVDHPSILNYWLKDKEGTEGDEQALLRYFAGCENLTMSDANVGDSKVVKNRDPKAISEGTDITFYIFFPNNYSGVDYDDAINGLGVLFGGDYVLNKNTNEISVHSLSEGGEEVNAFLGYEMGINSVSDMRFAYTLNERTPENYNLGEVYSLKTAEDNPFDSTIPIGYDFSDKNIDGKYDYNEINLLFRKFGEYKKTLKELENERMTYEKQNTEIENSLVILNKEREKYVSLLENENDLLKKSLYQTELERIEKEIISKESIKEENNKILNNFTIRQNASRENDSIVESKLNNFTSELMKTKPLYFYGKITKDGKRVTETCEIFDNIWEPLVQRDVENLKVYITSDESKTPYEFLSVSNDVVCKTKAKNRVNNTNTYVETYWFKEYVDQTFVEIENIGDFDKAGYNFAKLKGETVYYVKTKTGKRRFSSEQDAVEYIKKNSERLIKEFKTEDELKKQNVVSGIVRNDGVINYYTLKLTKLANETEVVQKLREKYIGIVSENNVDDATIKRVYEEYYKKHGKITDSLLTEDYGMVQYFYTGNQDGDQYTYKTIQEFVNMHPTATADIKDNNIVIGEAISGSSPSKYCKINENDNTDKSPRNTCGASWIWGGKQSNSRTYHYPHDKWYDMNNPLTIEKNYFNTDTFGLNVSLEQVKNYKKDDSITFSFAEVYAAAVAKDDEWERYKEHVETCEIAWLKNIFKDNNSDELKTKIEEISYRLEYLRNFFNGNDKQQDNISQIKIRGTATKTGSSAKNIELSENRRKILENFLRGVIKKKGVLIEMDERNLPDEDSDENISSIKSKLGRTAKVTIVVEDMDKDTAISMDAVADEDIDNKKIVISQRYDNEQRFFEMLEANNNIAYKQLVDKVKYFSPSFHSITPEGFNARLTFLHQCTRQGPTKTSTDISEGTTASNLAFGRAPFCILRLGDFLNTKIIIESVDIDYDDNLWDLNPDGIGAQFMMAKISLGIKIIGGSDISAPIKRLQNAVSFNYYANTSIYDNRSDTAEYGSNGNIIDTGQWFA